MGDRDGGKEEIIRNLRYEKDDHSYEFESLNNEIKILEQRNTFHITEISKLEADKRYSDIT